MVIVMLLLLHLVFKNMCEIFSVCIQIPAHAPGAPCRSTVKPKQVHTHTYTHTVSLCGIPCLLATICSKTHTTA